MNLTKTGSTQIRTTALALAAATLAALAAAAPASASTTWLCKPGLANNVCSESQKTTLVSSSGSRKVFTPSVPSKPKFDCFYVYPTTSDQKQPQADFQLTPELTAIARNQAQPYSQACSVYAPIYRQVTLQGLLNPSTVTSEMREQGYQDVVAAWRDFVANYSHGRPFLLVGHSQGSFVLRRLIAEEIDKTPALRKRLVAAHLTGGNVLVAKGSDAGGDFKNIPACRKATQTRCVIAYSTFNSAVPAESRFGRTASTPWNPSADSTKQEVLCTNPANLRSGGSGALITRNSLRGFPGTIGLAIGLLGRILPTGLSTLWVEQRDLYSATCAASNGANVLMVSSLTSQRPLNSSPDATWGLHLADMNIAFGNLLAIAKSEGKAWRK